MSKQQKQIAAVAGGLVLLYLLYRWYSNNQAGSTSTGAVAPNTSSGDYAALAGQEQGDVAALQGQNSQLYNQEQADIAGLTTDIGGLTTNLGTVTTDVNGLTTTVGGLGDQINQILGNESSMTGSITTIGDRVTALATGVDALNRHQNESIQTHKGGPFYNYYVKVTGSKPPKTVAANNFVYQAWKSGVKAAALHPPKSHPNVQNTGHNAKPTVKPAAPKPPPKPSTKPNPPSNVTKPKVTPPKPPPKSVGAKKSGVRR